MEEENTEEKSASLTTIGTVGKWKSKTMISESEKPKKTIIVHKILVFVLIEVRGVL